MLTRAQFDTACKQFIAKYTTSTDHPQVADALKGWVWNEHPSMPTFGYMSRSVIHTWRSQPLAIDELPLDGELDDAYHEDDAAALSMPVTQESLTAQQWIVYSATFQVPGFYFTMHNSRGTPLSLDNLLQSTLFRPFAFEKSEVSTFALTRPDSSFPLLSQGDHPTLGTPCWYLHPCQSADAVEEIIKEVQLDGCIEELRLVRWLEAWFMILGTTVHSKP